MASARGVANRHADEGLKVRSVVGLEEVQDGGTVPHDQRCGIKADHGNLILADVRDDQDAARAWVCDFPAATLAVS
jgi:hypothetical protein